MIVFDDGNYETGDWLTAETYPGRVAYVVEEGSELAGKVKALYPYFTLNVVDGVLVDVTELEKTLTEIKAAKFEELNAACNQDVLAGFSSSALGADHSYDFDYEAQINFSGMLNAITAGIIPAEQSVVWKTVDAGPLSHTIAEFTQLYADGLAHKNGKIAAYWTKKGQVEAATTGTEVTAVVW